MDDVAGHAPRVVASIFAFDAVILYLTENDTAYSSDPRRPVVSLEELRTVARLPEDRGHEKTEYALFPWSGNAGEWIDCHE